MITKTEICSLLQIVPLLITFMRALVHINTGISRGSDHIKPTVTFCPCTAQNFFRHTSDCLDYPCTKGCRVNHICSGNIILHIPPQEENQLRDIREAWGPWYWSTTANPPARKYFIKKCPRIVTPVWGYTIMLLNDKWLQFFQLCDHVQLQQRMTPVLDNDVIRATRDSECLVIKSGINLHFTRLIRATPNSVLVMKSYLSINVTPTHCMKI